MTIKSKGFLQNCKLLLLFESDRLKTFAIKWVFGDDKLCSTANLARAGFYYTGTTKEPDAVTCFMCDKVLEGWEQHDDPWKEHEQHNNDCYFVAVHKDESDLTVAEYCYMWGTLRLKYIKQARLQIAEARAETVKYCTATCKWSNKL